MTRIYFSPSSLQYKRCVLLAGVWSRFLFLAKDFVKVCTCIYIHGRNGIMYIVFTSTSKSKRPLVVVNMHVLCGGGGGGGGGGVG